MHGRVQRRDHRACRGGEQDQHDVERRADSRHVSMIWGQTPFRFTKWGLTPFLAADEAEPCAEPAHRRYFERVGVDAPLGGDNQLDGAALSLEPQAGFPARAVLRAATRLPSTPTSRTRPSEIALMRGRTGTRTWTLPFASQL